MKTLFASLITFLAVLTLSCQDSRESSLTKDLSKYRNVGQQIPLETGQRWIELLNTKQPADGRNLGTGYLLSDSTMQAALQSVSNLVGIAFQHGIDEAGVHHFIAIPIDETMSVWSVIPGRLFVDTNTNTEISQQEASAWATNYQLLHPNEIWFHFFGAHVFEEISTISYFDVLNIVPALRDTDLAPQLLLVITTNDISPTGKIEGAGDDTTIYDVSSPCPPCDVH